jgi:1,4-alpha-glucan branching enzyme
MALKKIFSKDRKICTVIFTVASAEADGAKTISVAGDFNRWSSTLTPLTRRKNGSFSVRIPLEVGKEYQFRYLVDGRKWENDWKADKYIPAPYSDSNNSVVVTKPRKL